RGRHFLVIDGARGAVGEADEHVTATAEISRLGMDDGKRESDGYRCVNRVATFAQDFESRLGCQRARARDHRLGCALRLLHHGAWRFELKSALRYFLRRQRGSESDEENQNS